MPLAKKLGLEVVWMRPTMMLGPGDHLFRSTGLVVSFLKGSIPMFPSGGASMLDVRDSAAMFKAAMELPKLPRSNPTYTLGSHNCTVKGLFALFEKHTGVKAPTMTLPYTLLHFCCTLIYKASGRTNTTLDPVRAEMGSVFWDVDWSLAEKELGFKPRNHEETIKDTIAYVREHHEHPKVNGTKKVKGPPVQWLLPAVKGVLALLVALGVWRWSVLLLILCSLGFALVLIVALAYVTGLAARRSLRRLRSPRRKYPDVLLGYACIDRQRIDCKYPLYY